MALAGSCRLVSGQWQGTVVRLTDRDTTCASRLIALKNELPVLDSTVYFKLISYVLIENNLQLSNFNCII